jgi:hypothetical protein
MARTGNVPIVYDLDRGAASECAWTPPRKQLPRPRVAGAAGGPGNFLPQAAPHAQHRSSAESLLLHPAGRTVDQAKGTLPPAHHAGPLSRSRRVNICSASRRVVAFSVIRAGRALGASPAEEGTRPSGTLL